MDLSENAYDANDSGGSGHEFDPSEFDGGVEDPFATVQDPAAPEAGAGHTDAGGGPWDTPFDADSWLQDDVDPDLMIVSDTADAEEPPPTQDRQSGNPYDSIFDEAGGDYTQNPYIQQVADNARYAQQQEEEDAARAARDGYMGAAAVTPTPAVPVEEPPEPKNVPVARVFLGSLVAEYEEEEASPLIDLEAADTDDDDDVVSIPRSAKTTEAAGWGRFFSRNKDSVGSTMFEGEKEREQREAELAETERKLAAGELMPTVDESVEEGEVGGVDRPIVVHVTGSDIPAEDVPIIPAGYGAETTGLQDAIAQIREEMNAARAGKKARNREKSSQPQVEHDERIRDEEAMRAAGIGSVVTGGVELDSIFGGDDVEVPVDASASATSFLDTVAAAVPDDVPGDIEHGDDQLDNLDPTSPTEAVVTWTADVDAEPQNHDGAADNDREVVVAADSDREVATDYEQVYRDSVGADKVADRALRDEVPHADVTRELPVGLNEELFLSAMRDGSSETAEIYGEVAAGLASTDDIDLHAGVRAQGTAEPLDVDAAEADDAAQDSIEARDERTDASQPDIVVVGSVDDIEDTADVDGEDVIPDDIAGETAGAVDAAADDVASNDAPPADVAPVDEVSDEPKFIHAAGIGVLVSEDDVLTYEEQQAPKSHNMGGVVEDAAGSGSEPDVEKDDGTISADDVPVSTESATNDASLVEVVPTTAALGAVADSISNGGVQAAEDVSEGVHEEVRSGGNVAGAGDDVFVSLEATYRGLWEQHNSGDIGVADLREGLSQLKVESDGVTWVIGAQTGKWYHYDESTDAWIQDIPYTLETVIPADESTAADERVETAESAESARDLELDVDDSDWSEEDVDDAEFIEDAEDDAGMMDAGTVAQYTKVPATVLEETRMYAADILRRYAIGELDRDEAERELQANVVKHDHVVWAVGARTGAWYYYDDDAEEFVKANPRADAPNPQLYAYICRSTW